MVAEIYYGKSLQCRRRLCYFDESPDMGGKRTLSRFCDPLMDCKECHERFRADKLIEDYAEENGITLEKPIDAYSQEEMKAFIEDNNVPCPTCGKHNFTDIRQFNLMFKTFQGVTEDAKNTVYLRPETAQGIFVNFKNVQRTSRKKSVRYRTDW